MTNCPHCGFETESPVECPRCGVVFAKYHPSPHEAFRPKPRPPDPAAAEPAPAPPGPRVLLAALPAAFLSAWLFKHFFLTRIVFEACRLWLHEFGHALVAWLSGRAATPLGFGWTNFNPEKSLVVFCCFAFLLGVSFWKSVAAKAFALAGVILGLFLLQLLCTFGLSPDTFELLMSYGGIGGEFYLGALLTTAFYFKFPKKMQWEFLRYPVLLIGAYSLLNTFLQWLDIAHHRADLPWGTLLYGEEDAGGDMNRLVDMGFSRSQIVGLYLRTGLGCIAAVGTAYLVGALRLLGRKSGNR